MVFSRFKFYLISNTTDIMIILVKFFSSTKQMLLSLLDRMVKIVIKNVAVKGYHEFKIRPPPTLDLPGTKEYGNRHDPNACLVWVPELVNIPERMWSIDTDNKRGETVQTIAGLPIGRVPEGLSACFSELLSSSHVVGLEW